MEYHAAAKLKERFQKRWVALMMDGPVSCSENWSAVSTQW